MSKLHKRCFFASAGLHVLLFVVLLVGPAFLMSRDKIEDMPTLDFIPSKLIDEQLYRQSAPTPKPSKPAVQQTKVVPPKPARVPEPEPVKPTPKPEPEPEKAWKPTPVKITDARRKRISADVTKPAVTPRQADPKELARAIRQLSSQTTIDVPPGGGVPYANYAQAVKSIYERNWSPPDESSRDDAVVKVRIVIARDGAILSSSIIGRSGDGGVDSSVEATLRRVTRVPPFPEGAKERTRTFTIGFNLKARRAMG